MEGRHAGSCRICSRNTLAGFAKIRWQGLQKRSIPDGSKFWCRISKQTVFEEQATLSTCEGAPGQKKYTASGLVFVQLFCPKSESNAFGLGEQLAKIARDAFRGKSTENNIWFRNVRINEIPDEELYERFNIVGEFEYDELNYVIPEAEIIVPQPMRSYFKPSGSNYFSLPTMALRSGNILRFDFLANTENPTGTVIILSHITGSNSITVGVTSSGTYFGSDRVYTYIDGVRVYDGFVFPTDGLKHTFEIVGVSYGQVSRIHTRYSGELNSRFVIWNIECTASDQGAFFYAVDEGSGSVLYDTMQEKTGSIVGDLASSWYEDVFK